MTTSVHRALGNWLRLEGIQSLLSLPANEPQAKGSPTSSVPKSRSPAFNPSPQTPRWRAPQQMRPWAFGCDGRGSSPSIRVFQRCAFRM